VIFWLWRKMKKLGRRSICLSLGAFTGIGHKLSTRRRGPLPMHGIDIWCRRNCGFHTVVR